MQVLKFGGTSVGSPQRMQNVLDLIQGGTRKIVVLSAVSGTTNKLVALADALAAHDTEKATSQLAALRAEYAEFIYQLYADGNAFQQGKAVLDEHFQTIEDCFTDSFSTIEERLILAQGELISTKLFQIYAATEGVNSMLITALDFMRIDENNEPDVAFTREKLSALIAQYPNIQYFITQGYICRNAKEEVDNLKRGGSDYTATLIGAALGAAEIQIWTDIDGMHNNDPRAVDETFPVRKLSYREAAELAYFGAKILHPTCVLPAEKEQVAIRLKSTFEPDAPGTLISNESSHATITAIAAKDGIIAIKVRSTRMLMAYGFLTRVFEVFEKYKTPIDMITTSEVAISLTIDDDTHLQEILEKLRIFGEVSCERNQTIICVVGDALEDKKGIAKQLFGALQDVPIRMVSYGGSDNNVSILIGSEYKKLALQSLNVGLFPQLYKSV
ncbi:MAG: hypothetical protein RI943_1285 [Bacteroidota bacterium]